jgi:hypothetical protein
MAQSIYSSDPDSALSREGMPQKGEKLTKYGHEHLAPHHTLHGGLSQLPSHWKRMISSRYDRF